MKWNKVSRVRFFVIMAVCLLVFPLRIKAEDKEYQFDYAVLNGKAYIEGIYGGKSETLIVPEKIGQYTVAGIGNPHPAMPEGLGLGFNDEEDHDEADKYLIKKVVLPKTIEYVMEGFLGDNAGVEELVISDGACFQVPLYVYRDEQKESVKKIYIGNAMTDVTTERLVYGGALEEIVVSDGNPVYKSQDGILFSKDMKALLVCPTKKRTEKYVVPEGVTHIGVGFQCCQDIKIIQLPESFEYADNVAFEKCSAQVIYPQKKADINKTEKQPDSGSETVNPAIRGTVFTVAESQAKFKVTGSDAENPTVEYAGLTASGKKKKTVSIPEYVSYNGVKYHVTSVAEKCFKNNKKLTSVKIPDSVTKIGNSAFEGCSSLKTVTVGKGLKAIGKNVFKNCKSLKKITLKSTKLKTVGKTTLKGVNAKCRIKVSAKKVKAYKKLFKGKVQKASVKIIK